MPLTTLAQATLLQHTHVAVLRIGFTADACHGAQNWLLWNEQAYLADNELEGTHSLSFVQSSDQQYYYVPA